MHAIWYIAYARCQLTSACVGIEFVETDNNFIVWNVVFYYCIPYDSLHMRCFYHVPVTIKPFGNCSFRGARRCVEWKTSVKTTFVGQCGQNRANNKMRIPYAATVLYHPIFVLSATIFKMHSTDCMIETANKLNALLRQEKISLHQSHLAMLR